MFSLLGIAAASAAFVGPGHTLTPVGSNNPITVEVTSAAEEQMARRLASAVMKEFKRDRRFTLAENGAQRALNIAMPNRIGWERRLDWTEISYQARLNLADGQSRVVAGQCWNWNLAACAKQITGAAATFAGN